MLLARLVRTGTTRLEGHGRDIVVTAIWLSMAAALAAFVAVILRDSRPRRFAAQLIRHFTTIAHATQEGLAFRSNRGAYPEVHHPRFPYLPGRRQTIQIFTASPERARPDARAIPREMELAIRLPMAAPNYAAQRSALAKQIGLGQTRWKASIRKSVGGSKADKT
jgi:hypothetical protein